MLYGGVPPDKLILNAPEFVFEQSPDMLKK
jgi:hypothetical protein